MDTTCVVLAVLASAGWTGFLVLLFLGGSLRPRARHVAARTAERRARNEVTKLEQTKVQEVADRLDTEARSAGKKFSRRELEREARRLLMQAGSGITP